MAVVPSDRSFTADITFVTGGGLDFLHTFENCEMEFENEKAEAKSPRDINENNGTGVKTMVGGKWSASFSGNFELASADTVLSIALKKTEQTVIITRKLVRGTQATGQAALTYQGSTVVMNANIKLDQMQYGKAKIDFTGYGDLAITRGTLA